MSQNFVSLGEIAQFINGDRGKNYPAKGSFVDEGVAFINAGSLSQEHSIDSCSLNYITEAKYDSLSSGKVAQGDILFCLRGSIGKFALITEQMTGAIASSLVIVRPSEKVFTGYLKHYFASNLCRREIDNFENGAAQPNLSATDLKEFRIPLPPLVEQKRIAAILDKADAIRQKRKQAIDLADEFLRSVFLDMFGDPVTNPKGFRMSVLKEFYMDEKTGTKCGPFGSALKKEEFVETGVPVWNMDNISLSGIFFDSPRLWITPEKYEQISSYGVEDGDVIISRAGTVGKMGVVRTKFEDSLISTNLIRVRFSNRLRPEYFVSLMTYCKGRVGRLKTGPDGSFTHMNTGILDKLEFPYPPIELQDKFIEVLKWINSNLDKQVNSELNELFESLSQKAFSGEL
ncbi:restriction endonuclease subunit S [Vibrio sp. 10N.247.311.18]|uniref:restriction endonuclease subunit S n=1 Tax=unclassified Vibrio TaxID=2614977 RepID=UPI003551E880